MTDDAKRPFASLTLAELEAELAAGGYRRFVADQVLRGVYERGAGSFDEITNVKSELRHQLADRYWLRTLEVVAVDRASDASFKLVLRLADGGAIECAYLPTDGERGTACVSSQVGCAMGCVFCASGATGLERNLEAFEIIEQLLLLRDHLPKGRTLSHVTVMGVGEPLANLDAVLAALEVAGAAWGLGIGARRIAISTCGLPEGIRRLAALDRQYHLAVSLHAADDRVRRKLMPQAARAASVDDLLAACRQYFDRTRRKVTFEVVLIRGVNDDLAHAELLARRLGGLPALVNLIPVNPTACCPDLEPPSPTHSGRFLAVLQRAGIEATLRKLKGAEVHAACGQLRARVPREK